MSHILEKESSDPSTHVEEGIDAHAVHGPGEVIAARSATAASRVHPNVEDLEALSVHPRDDGGRLATQPSETVAGLPSGELYDGVRGGLALFDGCSGDGGQIGGVLGRRWRCPSAIGVINKYATIISGNQKHHLQYLDMHDS